MNKKKKIEKTLTIFTIIIGLALLAVLSINLYNDFFKRESNDSKKEIGSIELFGYVLHEEDTELYKNEFNILSEILSEKEIDYEEYAKSLTKMFIIDFYTLTNKKTSTDVGALTLIHPDQLENFKVNAGDTIYKYVESNIDGNRTQKLPEVKSIEIISITEKSYTYKESELVAYELKTSWEYVNDLGYQTNATFTLIKEGTKLFVIKGE